MLLLLMANTLNIAVEVAAMGEGGEPVTEIDRHAMMLGFGASTLLLVPGRIASHSLIDFEGETGICCTYYPGAHHPAAGRGV